MINPESFKVTIGHKKEPYYVYEHYFVFKAGGEQLAYLGICLHSELFEYPDAKRNSEWVKAFTKGEHLRIQVLHVAKTIEEAEAVATYHRAIKGYYCNREGRLVNSTGCVSCSNGETYPSANAAAKSLRISQPALSRHLRGKPGHRSIKGLTFTFVTE